MSITKFARKIAQRTATLESKKIKSFGEWIARRFIPSEYYAGKVQEVANPYHVTVAPEGWDEVSLKTVQDYLGKIKDDVGNISGSSLQSTGGGVTIIPQTRITEYPIEKVKPEDFLIIRDVPTVSTTPGEKSTLEKIRDGWELSDSESLPPSKELVEAYERMREKMGLEMLGKKLSSEFNEPALRELVARDSQYYTPLKLYMEKGMSELEALRQLIIDRNTAFRMFSVFGHSDESALARMTEVSDKYALEFTPSMNQAERIERTNPNDGIFPLYLSSYPNDNYGDADYAWRSQNKEYGIDAQGKGARESRVSHMRLPQVLLTRRVKLQPKFDFSGDPTTWFEKNPTIPTTEKMPGALITLSKNRIPNYGPHIFPKKYKGKIDSIISRFPRPTLAKFEIYYEDFPSMYNSIIPIEGPQGTKAPLQIVDFEDFFRKKTSNTTSRDVEIYPPFAYPELNSRSKFETPLVPYGFHKGGIITQ